MLTLMFLMATAPILINYSFNNNLQICTMGMEDDTRAFLVLVLNTMALVLLWMIANVLFGIYLGYAFFKGSPSWKNILYYILSLSSLLFLIKHLRKKWNL